MSTPAPASTNWVPLWDLNGGVNLDYKGAYVTATQYKDGDVVVQNGIAYMCVRPTVNPPAVWPMAPGTTAYGTSLPASPYDGQEAVLVDSLTNPSYSWRFRYNASSTSPYKWEFVGGAPKYFNYDAGAAAMNNAGFTTASGWYWWNNPQGSVFPPPRAGTYAVRCKLYGTNNLASVQNIWIGAILVNNATPAVNAPVACQACASVPASSNFTMFSGCVWSPGTNEAVGLGWTAASIGNAVINGVYVEITPQRVM